MNPGSRQPAHFNYGVQGLRGFSAVSVLIVHLFEMAAHAGFEPTSLPWLLKASAATMGNGVSLFFIISGFVIPASLDRHADLRRFFTDRILRIVPLFLVIHLLVFGIGPFIGYKWLLDISALRYIEFFLANLFFVAPLLGIPLAQQNGWTLTYEWIFYIAAAATWQTRRSRSHMLLPVVLGVAACLAAFRPVSLFFLVGMAFARIRLPSIRLPAAIEIAVLATSLALFYATAQYVSDLASLGPGAVVFVLVVDPTSLTSRLLSGRAFQFLGKTSYSLYLIHPVVLFPFQIVFGRLAAAGYDRGMLFLAFVVLGSAAAIVASGVSYTLIEVQGRRWAARWLAPAGAGLKAA